MFFGSGGWIRRGRGAGDYLFLEIAASDMPTTTTAIPGTILSPSVCENINQAPRAMQTIPAMSKPFLIEFIDSYIISAST